jgi:hypothetical protein
MRRCLIPDEAPAGAICMQCYHPLREHVAGSGLCLDCLDIQLARLEMTEALHVRVDQLAFAVQVLTERLDNAQLDRLDAIASAWPQRQRTVHGAG